MERRHFLQQVGFGAATAALAATPAAIAAAGPTTTKQDQSTMIADKRHPYEPLTSDNAAVLLVDHQIGLFTGVRDIPVAELKHNVVALARAATVLKLPVIATTTAAGSMWGPTIPELVEALPGHDIIDRSSVNAWDEPRIVKAIEATARRKLIIAGISLEVCVAFPALSALSAGYDVYAAVDASGTFSETKRTTGLLRLTQAGAVVSDYATLMVEVLADNARPEAGAVYGALDMPFATLVGQLSSAYARKRS
jgi:nicotinamidase-related amidase